MTERLPELCFDNLGASLIGGQIAARVHYHRKATENAVVVLGLHETALNEFYQLRSAASVITASAVFTIWIEKHGALCSITLLI